MDDLSFRKAIYADPKSKDPALVQAAKDDPNKQAFWDEILEMETQLQQAMQVAVPENLADRLILRQSIQDSERQKSSKRPWYLGIAASVLLASVISIQMLTQTSTKLRDDIYVHMQHTDFELQKSVSANLDIVNAKLANFNGQLTQELGEILTANFCYLDNIRSLHLIVKSQNGLTSLFVVPDALTGDIDERFENDDYVGRSLLVKSAKVIVVGEYLDDVEGLISQAGKALSFSA